MRKLSLLLSIIGLCLVGVPVLAAGTGPAVLSDLARLKDFTARRASRADPAPRSQGYYFGLDSLLLAPVR